MDEELLTGGNTHAAIVRIGDTVRRPTGPWTPGVQTLIRSFHDGELVCHNAAHVERHARAWKDAF